MKKKVLITGASGFVGFHLIEAALQSDLEVYAAVRKSSKVDHLAHLNIHYVYLDFSEPDLMKAQLEEGQYDYIIHAAGITKTKAAGEYFLVNAEYTRNLAVAAMVADIPLKKFVFISSLAALGPAAYDATHTITEDKQPEPVTNYGRSKLQAEQYLRTIKDLPLMIFRPTAVYGPREKDILIMFKSLKKGIEPYIGNIPQRLSFIYAKDLATIVVAGMLRQGIYQSYNVSDGKGYSRYALADITKSVLGKKTFKMHLPLGVVNIIVGMLELAYANSRNPPTLNKEKLAELQAPNWVCNIDRLKKDLGITPAHDLEAGVKETLAWYQRNKWL